MIKGQKLINSRKILQIEHKEKGKKFVKKRKKSNNIYEHYSVRLKKLQKHNSQSSNFHRSNPVWISLVHVAKDS